MTRRLRLSALVLTLLIVFALLFHFFVHFDWSVFWTQLHRIDATPIGIGVSLIYLSVLLRAQRWAILVKPLRSVPSHTLIGPQFIGFACVALFGSLGDLTRPYLLARRLQLPISTQLATYTIERMLDIVAIALIASASLLLDPGSISEAHRPVFLHLGIAGALATLILITAVLVLKFYGDQMVTLGEQITSRISPRFGVAIGMRLRSFRAGLTAITSLRDLASVLALSLAIWGLVAIAYLQVAHAFTHTAALASLSFAQTMLLVAASVGGSLLQLPIIGWFTQIAATTGVIHTLFSAPVEAATACGALILCVTFVSLIPAGLVFAHFERISVRTVLQASEDLKLEKV